MCSDLSTAPPSVRGPHRCPVPCGAVTSVLGNPAAQGGRGGDMTARVVARLRELGAEPQLLAAPSADVARARLREVVDAGESRVVVVGGDGMVHLAAGELRGRGVALGIVGAGTGNDTVRALGLPDKLDAAVDAALGPARAIDLIDGATAPVVTVATVGFAGDVTARADRMRRPRGSSRYTIATLRELPSLTPRRLWLDLDGRTEEVEATMLAVGNTAFFGGGMEICVGADPTDGVLDVTVIGAVGRLELLRVFPRVFKGTHVDHPKVTTYRAKLVAIDGDADLWGDGEPVGRIPAQLSVDPGALLVAGVG